jgi:hypothetical protein
MRDGDDDEHELNRESENLVGEERANELLSLAC